MDEYGILQVRLWVIWTCCATYAWLLQLFLCIHQYSDVQCGTLLLCQFHFNF